MKYLMAILLFFAPLAAQAGSTALSPAKFVVRGENTKIISESVVVKNLSNTVQHYSFYPEEGSNLAGKNVSVVPSQFVLQPQESLAAVVRIRPADKSWRANLNLVAYSASQMNADFRVGDGIKIPVFFNAPQVLGQSVKITGVTLYFWLLTIFIFNLALSVLGVVFYLYYRHTFWRQIRARHKINFL